MPLRAPEAIDDTQLVTNGVNDDGTILPVCAALAAKVNAFLEAEAETPLLKAVQEQTRVALGVISKTLERYRYEVSRI